MLASLLILTACQDSDPNQDATDATTRQQDGPLRAGGDGGFAADPPPKAGHDYVVTFGGFLLCSTTSAVPVIDRVTLGATPPQGARVALRTVTPALVEETPRSQRRRLVPLAATWGSPPEFSEPYVAVEPPLGTFDPLVEGIEVDESCSDTYAAQSAVNKWDVPADKYLELMVVVPVETTDGAEVDGFTIDYTADGEDYSLDVPWTMVACDDAATRQQCGAS